MRRMREFRNRGGEREVPFIRSILETYGAPDGERLPFGCFLTCASRWLGAGRGGCLAPGPVAQFSRGLCPI